MEAGSVWTGTWSAGCDGETGGGRGLGLRRLALGGRSSARVFERVAGRVTAGTLPLGATGDM